jgi:hypothetical protein
MISVLAGGMAHQTFTTIALQNTMAFRFLWTICVGAVAMASAFMGAAASSLLQYDTTSKRSNGNITSSSSSQWSLHKFVPILPVSFWFVYAIGITGFVMIGGFSFQRPACDIFVVGITQFPSTFYMMLVLYSFGGTTDSYSTTSTSHGKASNSHTVMTLSNRMKYIACCGFILNAPLLPLYPILVQYTNWSLGMINTLLHTWLLMAWTCQGMSLRQISVQWILLQQEEEEAKEGNESPSRLLQPTLSQTIPDSSSLSTSS